MEKTNVISFPKFLESLHFQRYKIRYCRVENKPHIYVKTDGLFLAGLKEIFTISKSPDLEDAALLINLLVRRLMDTNQKTGVRKDLIRHPTEGYQLRYLIRQSIDEKETLIILGPDDNNLLPGEYGYKNN